MKPFPSLTYILGPQYEYAKRFEDRSTWMRRVGVLVNLSVTLMFSAYPFWGDHLLVATGITATSAIILLLDARFDTIFRDEYEKAEKIRMFQFARTVMNSGYKKVEESYLLLSINRGVLEEARNRERDAETNSGSEVNSTTNFFTSRESFAEKVIEKIQQNCHETGNYMRIYADELARRNIPISVGLLVLILIICISLGATEISKISIGQLVAGIFAAVFTLDIFPYYQSFRKKGKQLKEIDDTLEFIKNHDPDTNDLLFYFAEYNSVLVNAHPFPGRIWEKHSDRIDNIWKTRLLNPKGA